MRELNKKIEDLNNNDDILDVIIENEDEIIANSMYEAGVKKGISQNSINIAKKLLKKNINIKEISEITNLSEKEIENLKYFHLFLYIKKVCKLSKTHTLF